MELWMGKTTGISRIRKELTGDAADICSFIGISLMGLGSVEYS